MASNHLSKIILNHLKALNRVSSLSKLIKPANKIVFLPHSRLPPTVAHLQGHRKQDSEID